MSHELRTPLNAVIGARRLLLLDAIRWSSASASTREGIASSGRHLLALVNDVLDLAKSRAGKQQLDLRRSRSTMRSRKGLAAIVPLANARG